MASKFKRFFSDIFIRLRYSDNRLHYEKMIIIIFAAMLFAYYLYISFLSLLDGIDEFFLGLFGINTGLWLRFMFPYEERENMTLDNYRFDALNDYFNQNLEFVLSKRFYIVAAIIIILSAIGWRLNDRKSKSYKLSKIVLVIISVFTVLLTISNAYYNWWWWDTEVV